MPEMSMSAQQHARNILLTLFSAVLSAFILVGGMVYYYGPSASYRLEHVLLEPQNLFSLNYSEVNSATGRSTRYLFHSLEFSFPSSESNRWERKMVTESGYRSFFQLLAGEKSVANPADEVIHLFEASPVAVLSLKVRLQSGQGVSHFQEVQFLLNGDYYRVEVHEDSPSVQWAYFKHPGIYRAVLQIFGGPQ